MDSWGNIRQRPRLISVDFMNGQSRTYEHTLHLDAGFMSCPLSLKNSFEPIEYMVVDEVCRMRSEIAIHSKSGFFTQQRWFSNQKVCYFELCFKTFLCSPKNSQPPAQVFGNTYEKIPNPEKTSEGKLLEHKWKLFVRILKGDPTFIRRVEINLGSNWQLRKQSAPDGDNEFSTGYETSWGAITSKEREIIMVFADDTVRLKSGNLKNARNQVISILNVLSVRRRATVTRWMFKTLSGSAKFSNILRKRIRRWISPWSRWYRWASSSPGRFISLIVWMTWSIEDCWLKITENLYMTFIPICGNIQKKGENSTSNNTWFSHQLFSFIDKNKQRSFN